MYGKSVKTGSYIYRTYRIIEELGSGGSGDVYMAWHIRLRKYVVIKVVRKYTAGAIEVLRNEVEALKNIKNMHIPQVLDFMTESDYSFTVMEYIEGENFDNLLKNGKQFTEAQIIKWYCQLTSALDAIHKHEICHRDIKPANIMLTPHDNVCLIDFNSALVSGNNTGVISRSMGYASPEQYEYFRLCRNATAKTGKVHSNSIETALLTGDCKTVPISGLGIPGHRSAGGNSSDRYRVDNIDWKLSDIYSLGASMYHFLTGKRPPVKADEAVKIPYLKGYSECLLKIIERSMRTNPSERFASAKELGEALRMICL